MYSTACCVHYCLLYSTVCGVNYCVLYSGTCFARWIYDSWFASKLFLLRFNLYMILIYHAKGKVVDLFLRCGDETVDVIEIDFLLCLAYLSYPEWLVCTLYIPFDTSYLWMINVMLISRLAHGAIVSRRQGLITAGSTVCAFNFR